MKTNATSTSPSCWHIVYTSPNTEKKIYNELCKRSINAYLPVNQVVRQWSDRKKKLELPLFPNYIFVKVTAREMWSVLMVAGVLRFISFGQQIAVIKDEEIETIKKLLHTNPEVNQETDCVIGDRVKVTDGPFKGLEGTVSQVKGYTRLFVSLETINRVLSVEIPEWSVTKY
jgi:transcription antitermination factor NusG